MTSSGSKYLTGEARRTAAVELKRRYEDGLSIRQIAEESGYPASTVAGLLHYAGTRMRPNGQHVDFPDPDTL
jgi:DNA-directed RNA polymerase specialized sigma24 family protein